VVTYEFYKNTYLGSALSEVAFKQATARAEEWIAKLERSCRIVPYGPDSRAMAVCAVAETMEVFRKRWMIKSESIGGVSVSYDPGNHSDLQRQLLQNASVYLDICRGVG
jgi:hypothetical protein